MHFKDEFYFKYGQFHSSLPERSIYKSKIGNTLSDKHITTAGVLQEGVLSDTLFLVAIKTILDTLYCGVKGSPYADNLVIYYTSKMV